MGKRVGVLRNPTRWDPKSWIPDYDRIVGWSFLGRSNKQIAELTGYTKEHVSNILCTERAEQLMQTLQERQRDDIKTDMPTRFSKLAEKALARVEELLDSDEHFEKSPFAVVDRSLKILEGVGQLKGPGGSTSNIPVLVQGNAAFFNMPSEQAQQLVAGLDKANEVRRLHILPPSSDSEQVA